MTPDELAKSGSEHAHQRALFAWVNIAKQYGSAAAFDAACYSKGGKEHADTKYGFSLELVKLKKYYAIPNGGERNKAVAAKLKAEGVLAGTPDTHLPVACGNYHSLYIEMKKFGGCLSPAQQLRFPELVEEGNAVYVCYTWKEAVECLRHYLGLGSYR